MKVIHTQNVHIQLFEITEYFILFYEHKVNYITHI